jgi:hypothetical protein
MYKNSIILILILILILFYIINYLLKKNYETFVDFQQEEDTNKKPDTNSWNNFCGINNSNSNSKTYESSTEEDIVLNNCAGENEKCYVDIKGNNTCCGNYNCISLKQKFNYKVCSNDKDACGYYKFINVDYFKYLFNDEWWNNKFENIKNIFFQKNPNISEKKGRSILDKKREEILNSMDFLCGGKSKEQMNDSNFITYVIKEIEKEFMNDQIFSGLIYGVKESVKKNDNSDNSSYRVNNSRRRCT